MSSSFHAKSESTNASKQVKEFQFFSPQYILCHYGFLHVVLIVFLLVHTHLFFQFLLYSIQMI
uniref:Adenine-specific DNA methylase n=1 Tax=uncultured marine virus TaxID=186617 RepID=A0A0F7LA18_9VIRU|nr:adenine-specific DNA methylase [uncultured marine virus]